MWQKENRSVAAGESAGIYSEHAQWAIISLSKRVE